MSDGVPPVTRQTTLEMVGVTVVKLADSPVLILKVWKL